MTDPTEKFPEQDPVMIPEMADDMPAPLLPPKELALIDESVLFINRTISAKALEAALLVGNYVLANFFDDDIKAAFSQNPYKSISFATLCEHPDLTVSRQQLINMVKVAAQERYLKTIDINISSLGYTHRLKLTRLPNDTQKIEMARECITKDLNTRQLGYRVKKLTMKTKPPEDKPPPLGPAEKAADKFIDIIDYLAWQADDLDIESISENIGNIEPETRTIMKNKLITLIDTMSQTEIACGALLKKIQETELD